MKETQKTARPSPLRSRRLRAALSAQPMLRAAAQCAGFLLMGFLLAESRAAGMALPLGTCLIAAAGNSF